MQYFTKDLWKQMNDHDEAVRKEAEKKWSYNDSKYQKIFERTKEKLPKVFLDEYLLRNGFHDYTIQAISLLQIENRKYNCELQLSNGSEVLCLTLLDIAVFNVNISSFKNCVQGKLTWGYSEFKLNDSKRLSISILCDIENEMQFEFKTINIRVK